MTRRGSFAYYFVAVAVGCLFMAVSFQVHSGVIYGWEGWGRVGRDLLFVYFIAVMQGLFPWLLSAFLLRRAATGFGWQRAWPWVLAGTAAALAVVWALAWIGLAVERAYFPEEWQRAKNWMVLLMTGPMMVATGKPFWFPIPAAAATAFLLHKVHMRFNPPRGAASVPPSA